MRAWIAGWAGMLHVQWAKASDSQWFPLAAVDVRQVHDAGVYVIWHDGRPSRTIYVGHGDIAERLRERQADRAVRMYRKFGRVRVTWAHVAEPLQQSVARYLTEKLKPAFGDALLLVESVPVELPQIAPVFEGA